MSFAACHTSMHSKLVTALCIAHVSHINDSTVTNNYTNKTLYILLLTSYFPQSRQGDFLISNNDQFSVYYICRTTRQFFVNSYTTPWNKSWYFLEFSKLYPWIFHKLGHIFKNPPWNRAIFLRTRLVPTMTYNVQWVTEHFFTNIIFSELNYLWKGSL